MKDWLLVLPVIDPVLGRSCLDSMVGVPSHRIVVVDNCRQTFEYPAWRYSAHPRHNIGVSKSWNHAARMVLDDQRDYLVICSTSILFGANGGSDIQDRLDDTADEWGMEIDNAIGWHMIVFSRKTFETIGLFDEAFFPGYWNDTDFLYRMGLAGLPSPRENGRWMARTTLDIADRGAALSLTGGFVKCDMRAQGDLYRAKWGGDQGYEKFEKPFNGAA